MGHNFFRLGISGWIRGQTNWFLLCNANNIYVYIGFIWHLEAPQLVLSCLRAPKTFTGDSGKCVTIMDLSCIYCVVTRLKLWSIISEYSNILKNVETHQWQGVKKITKFSLICQKSCRSFGKCIRRTTLMFFFDDFNFLTTLLTKYFDISKTSNVLCTWSLLGKIIPNLLFHRMILHNPSHLNV